MAGVSSPLQHDSCPHLPAVRGALDYQVLKQHKQNRDGEFYYSALCYAQHLWRERHVGRALLALTRALYADLNGDEPVLGTWPLPYAAFRWMLENHHSDDFPGNPRLSFQHQACRLRGARCEIRSARAWALWAIVCHIRPQLPGDPSCPELNITQIAILLEKFGHAGELLLWQSSLRRVASLKPQSNAGKIPT